MSNEIIKTDPRSKKYYWLKLDRNFFKRHDVKILESWENGEKYVLFYMKLLLESMNHEGYLRYNEFIPYDEKMLATITDTDIDIVRSAIAALSKLQLMEVLDDRTIYLEGVRKMIGYETGYAKEKREQREAQKREELEAKRTLGTMSQDVPHDSYSISNSKSISKSNNNTKKKVNVYKVKYYENKELNDLFIEFLYLRRDIKARNTERAINTLLKILEPFSDDVKFKMIENSIVGSWKKVYPLKPNEMPKLSAEDIWLPFVNEENKKEI